MIKQVSDFIKEHALGLLLIVVGLAGGYLYYRLALCQSGACPLTSTPYYPMLVGGLVGAAAGDLLSALRERMRPHS